MNDRPILERGAPVSCIDMDCSNCIGQRFDRMERMIAAIYNRVAASQPPAGLPVRRYTVKQAAEYLGLHEESLRRKIRSHEIVCSQSGPRRYYFTEEQLQNAPHNRKRQGKR